LNIIHKIFTNYPIDSHPFPPIAEVNASGGFVEPGAVVSCREVRASEVKEDGSHCGEK
jgi:hypothetical protein